jgi:hypothetical protein
MTYFAQHGDVEISRLHNAAIRKEISEGLAIGMKPEPCNAAAFDDAHETIAR